MATADAEFVAKVSEVFRTALSGGALALFDTKSQAVPDGGVEFSVRLVDLAAKERLTTDLRSARRNPFLPHDDRLFVCNSATGAGETHKVLLNKFCIQPDHVLVVTTDYREQTEPLGAADWAALAPCVFRLQGLGFYNFGVFSGQSQPHKHMQVIPRPLSGLRNDASVTPLDPIVEASLRPGEAGKLPPYGGFRHACLRLPEGLFHSGADWDQVGARLQRKFEGLLGSVGVPLAPADPEGRVSYNVLLTPGWLLVVPRRREGVEGQEVGQNSVAFAGSMLVKSQAAVDYILSVGPIGLLRQIAFEEP